MKSKYRRKNTTVFYFVTFCSLVHGSFPRLHDMPRGHNPLLVAGRSKHGKLASHG
ncbi:hypothetical protein L218DRAFT_499825 [Marasmius fiardii PR-910]|nr:hypothetical protein L218DRAFT_499825 [Marasmius fiardii PR-910]